MRSFYAVLSTYLLSHSGVATNLRNCIFSRQCADFLIQTFSNYRWPSFSFPRCKLFWEIVRMSIEAVIYVKCYDLKKVKQVLRRPMMPLVTCVLLDYNIRSSRFYV